MKMLVDTSSSSGASLSHTSPSQRLPHSHAPMLSTRAHTPLPEHCGPSVSPTSGTQMGGRKKRSPVLPSGETQE
eukprot:4578428-Prymnesium_polylepis.1